MQIQPLHDQVLIQREEDETRSAGGIIIPDTAKEKPIRGKVVAAGSGKKLEDGTVRPTQVKAGDRVLFGKYSGTEIRLDGEDYLMMREEEILGTIH